MQTSLRPVVAPSTSPSAAVGYQYYHHSGAPHQLHPEHLEVMPEPNSMHGHGLPVNDSGINMNQYCHYDNYHHHQLELIHHHHHHQQQQQVDFHQQTIEPICYTSSGSLSAGEPHEPHQQMVEEHQVVAAYDNVHHYQLLQVPRQENSQQHQQVMVEVEQLSGELYQCVPEQQEQQQQTSYQQTIYYEPTIIEQPMIDQHQLQNHQVTTAFAHLAPLPPPPPPPAEAPEGCYQQFQYHHHHLDHLQHIESCNVALQGSGQLQPSAEPLAPAVDSQTQANYTAETTQQQQQAASFAEGFDEGGNQEINEQLQYQALELARVKNLSSCQQQESAEPTSSLLIQSQTGMTHSKHHHSHDHNHHHRHHHHRRDVSLSSSASSTSSPSASSSSSAASTSEESSTSSLTRDERKAREANIPLTYYEIVNLSIEQFNEQLAKYSLNEAQLTLIKDIRRRGKNKVAAQSCRKRKMEQIFELQHEVHQLASKRRHLGFECGQLIKEHANLVQEYDKVYAIIKERMQPPHLVEATCLTPPTTSSIT